MKTKNVMIVGDARGNGSLQFRDMLGSSLYTGTWASAAEREDVVRYLEEMGYTCTEYAFADTNDVFSVAQSACQGSDVLFVPDKQTFVLNAAEKLFISILYKKILEAALGAQAATLMTMRSAYETAVEYYEKLEEKL